MARRAAEDNEKNIRIYAASSAPRRATFPKIYPTPRIAQQHSLLYLYRKTTL
jgi:hypothetical protein